MADSQFPISRVLTLDSREEGVALCGPRDQFAHLVRDAFGVRVLTRGGDVLTLAGKTDEAVDQADRTFTQLRQIHRKQFQVVASSPPYVYPTPVKFP